MDSEKKKVTIGLILLHAESFLYRLCYVVRLGGYEIHSFFMLVRRET